MTIAVGDKVPDGVLIVRDAAGTRDVPLDALLRGRSVVIFGLPGAYTGTCSTAHVPSFIRTIGQFKARGVDEVVCVSVNDPMVMKAWGEATGATAAGITMASDCDASVTTAFGLDFAAGFTRGMIRSRRYAMHVTDGVVKVLNIEDSAGACTISAGEGLLELDGVGLGCPGSPPGNAFRSSLPPVAFRYLSSEERPQGSDELFASHPVKPKRFSQVEVTQTARLGPCDASNILTRL